MDEIAAVSGDPATAAVEVEERAAATFLRAPCKSGGLEGAFDSRVCCGSRITSEPLSAQTAR